MTQKKSVGPCSNERIVMYIERVVLVSTWSHASPEPCPKAAVRNELNQSHRFEQTRFSDDERLKFAVISVSGS